MHLILDSNEYIFAFGAPEGSPSTILLDVIVDTFPKHRIRITRMIVEEVKRNLVPEAFREFVGLISQLTGADALVTENRHFLSHRTDLSFRVLTAERCLRLIKS